jgi:hypothetical protein
MERKKAALFDNSNENFRNATAFPKASVPVMKNGNVVFVLLTEGNKTKESGVSREEMNAAKKQSAQPALSGSVGSNKSTHANPEQSHHDQFSNNSNRYGHDRRQDQKPQQPQSRFQPVAHTSAALPSVPSNTRGGMPSFAPGGYLSQTQEKEEDFRPVSPTAPPLEDSARRPFDPDASDSTVANYSSGYSSFDPQAESSAAYQTTSSGRNFHPATPPSPASAPGTAAYAAGMPGSSSGQQQYEAHYTPESPKAPPSSYHPESPKFAPAFSSSEQYTPESPKAAPPSFSLGPPKFAPAFSSSEQYTPESPKAAPPSFSLGPPKFAPAFASSGHYAPESPKAPPTTDFFPESPRFAPQEGSPPAMKEEAQDGDNFESNTEQGPSAFAKKMMMKMGFKEGRGLGKDGTGITTFIQATEKLGRAGLGQTSAFDRSRVAGLHAFSHNVGEVSTEVYVEWQQNGLEFSRSLDELTSGLQLAELNMCDSLNDNKASPTADYSMLASDDLARRIKLAKMAFDDMDRKAMRDAVTRSNPYELASNKQHHIYQNRAAMKMAEADWLFNLTARCKSNPDNDTPTRHDHLLYFADVCAGPGGFTEYLYWRRQDAAKGWGFTLRGDHDFRVDKVCVQHPVPCCMC